MTAGEWGQLLVKLIALAVFVFAYLELAIWAGRKLHEMSERYPPALPRDPMKYGGRDLTEAQRRKAGI